MNNIIMNDSMSMLLATTILALGGLGLYMYKSPHDSSSNDASSNDEDDLFGSSSIFNWGSDDTAEHAEKSNEDNLEEFEEDIKPRKRGHKTYKNRKSTGSSRRRY
jgi:hypothetical protein